MANEKTIEPGSASWALHTSEPALRMLLREKAAAHGALVCTTDPGQYDYLLEYHLSGNPPGYHVSLVKTGSKAPGPVEISFIRGRLAHRRKYGGGRGQELARAIGLKKGRNPSVWDLTAGLGRDGFVLATLGCQVTLVERSFVLYELLRNALEHGMLDEDVRPAIQRMQLVHADAMDYLRDHADDVPEVIYLDPMYPHRGKSALVKKEMRFLRDLVGTDDDAALVLQQSLPVARDRVVVKRPATASALPGPKPTTQVASKNTRYDIYITHQDSLNKLS